MAINFSFSQSGVSHFAQVIGSGQPRFFVGNEVTYLGNDGLQNLRIQNNMAYNPDNYENLYGYWAYFIAPTSKGESGDSFSCLNTYDRAKFTFGFMQYAAHVPNGDFVKYFKRLLALANAQDYFPKLVLQNNRIHYRNTNGSLTQLETSASTEELMKYLNPTLNDIERQEIICSARMVHWALNDARHRDLQVETAVEFFKENMRDYAQSYNLHGFPDKVCAMICDIRHQGRAKSSHIINAINTNGNFETAFNNLSRLGADNHGPRIRKVRAVITDLLDRQIFGKTYDRNVGDFV